jgi:replicative DNA helicase
MTAGFQKGDFIVVGARPSMGKTALVTGIALEAVVRNQTPAVMYSYEMSKQQVVQRLLCHEGLVNLHNMLKGRLRDDDYGRLAQVAGILNTAPLYIEDGGAQTVNAIRASARRLKAENPDLGLIVVDYLQLMEGGGDSENRNQEVSAISRGLKRLAKELDLCVIALSQLSRKLEDRANKRPQMSDLRESGSIEQDADLVMFLFREEYYNPTDASLANKAELIISKQRNGPTGTVDLYFRKECARFEAMQSWGVGRPA